MSRFITSVTKKSTQQRRAMHLSPAQMIELTSPSSLSMLSVIPLLISFFLPPAYYEYVVFEKDLMSYDFAMLAFYLACTGCFILGSKLAGRPNWSKVIPHTSKQSVDAYDVTKIWYLLGALIILNIISLILIVKASPNLIGNIINGLGYLAKHNATIPGTLKGAQPLLLAGSLWAIFRYIEHAKKKSFIENGVTKSLIWLSLILSVVISLAKLARYELVPLMIGLAIVFGYHRSLRGSVPITKFFAVLLTMFGVVGIIFFLFAFLRGHTNSVMLLSNFYGYGPASFNHLSAILNGSLQFPYGGTGVYVAPFLAGAPGFSDMPDAMSAYTTEFVATTNSGLNPAYNWITSFGYYYVDIGWWVLPFSVLLGLLAGFSWKSFLKKEAAGIIIYPYFAASIVLAGTFNMLVQSGMFIVCSLAPIIYLFERISSAPSRSQPRLR